MGKLEFECQTREKFADGNQGLGKHTYYKYVRMGYTISVQYFDLTGVA